MKCASPPPPRPSRPTAYPSSLFQTYRLVSHEKAGYAVHLSSSSASCHSECRTTRIKPQPSVLPAAGGHTLPSQTQRRASCLRSQAEGMVLKQFRPFLHEHPPIVEPSQAPASPGVHDALVVQTARALLTFPCEHRTISRQSLASAAMEHLCNKDHCENKTRKTPANKKQTYAQLAMHFAR